MKKDKLNQYVLKDVEITIFDGQKYDGILYKTETMKDPNFYLMPNHYVVISKYEKSPIFRAYMVTKIKEV